MSSSLLFTPVSIGPMTVPNRFVMPPMGNNFAHTDGSLSERSLAYYAARAKGGFGLVTIEATVVDPTAKGGPRKPCLVSDATIGSFQRVVQACHAEGAKVSVQLQHAGPEGNPAITGYPLKAASAVPAAVGKAIPQAMTEDEIAVLAEQYGDAARRAEEAGADAVELHCAHGYLLHSFLSPRTNHRTDAFGGCLENRLRIIQKIIENIRSKTGKGLAILCRINAQDDVPTLDRVLDSILIARALEGMGVDGLHVSRAVHLRDEWMWAPTGIPGGFNAPYGKAIKEAVGIPVILVGRFTYPETAGLLIEQGCCDLAAFGRQSIADPDMPNKALQGAIQEILPCIGCLQGCVCHMYAGKPVTCLVNPSVGREGEIQPAKIPKKIAVIGAGIAGLTAARFCAQQGHTVTVYEREDTAGGQMRLAAVPPGKGEFAGLIAACRAQCETAGVALRLGTPMTVDLLREEAPDVCILATGAQPSAPSLPGMSRFPAIPAWDVLGGKAACGENVLVLGGGLVGCETAAFLGERGHRVTVVEGREDIAADMGPEHRKQLLQLFADYAVQISVGTQVQELLADGALCCRAGEEVLLAGFDSVVAAFGARVQNPGFLEEARKVVPECYVIGDASSPRKAIDATREAFETALRIGEGRG